MSNGVVPNEARVALSHGLTGAVLSRVVGMLAARALCPVDRLDDALLVADAIAAHAPNYTIHGTLVVNVATDAETISLRVGPLRAEGAKGVIAESELPGVGNVIERVADHVVGQRTGEGDTEELVIAIAFVSPAARSTS